MNLLQSLHQPIRHPGRTHRFWNPVDIQKTVTSGDLDAIEEEPYHLVWKLSNYDGGGFMVKAYQQPESIGLTEAQAQRQYEVFKRYANYPLLPCVTGATGPADGVPPGQNCL
jgi:hypothetical protein